MCRLKPKLILTACLLLCFNLMQAAEVPVNPLEKGGLYQSFKNIYLPLDANVVNTVFQDEQGMMWFGTRRGLFSYNGYDFCNYVNDYTNDGNFINAILQISETYLCVGTNNGLLWFNMQTERYEAPRPELERVRTVLALAQFGGKLWIGTRGDGLFRFDMSTGELEKMSVDGMDETIVFAIEPAGDRLFVGSYEGLSCYDPSSGTGERIDLGHKERMMVESLLWSDGEQCLWVGTEAYLYRLDVADGRLTRIEEMGKTPFKALAVDSRQNLLAATDNGLFVYSSASGSVSHIQHDSGNSQSLANNVLWDIVCDRSRNVWIATDRGVSFTRSDDNSRFVHLSEIVHNVDGNTLSCMTMDSKGDWWLGGENGLIHIGDGGARVDWFRSTDKNLPLNNNHIRNIYEDRDGIVWIATDRSVARYDRSANRFIFYTLLDSARNKNSNWSYDFYEDGQGRLWIATYMGGVFVVDKKELLSSDPGRPFTHIIRVLDGDSGLSSSIYHILPDGNGRLWADTQEGLASIDTDTFDVSMKYVYMDNMIVADGGVYYSSEGHLFRFNIAEDAAETMPFSVEGGQIYAFVQENERVWFSATNGLFYYDEPTGKVECVSTSATYLQSGFYCRDAGEILWGGEDCVWFCSAGQQSIREGGGPVFITGLSRDDSRLLPSDDYDGGSPRFSTTVKLKSRSNFALELSSYSFRPDNDESFYYRLNKKDDWHVLDRNQNRIYFVEPAGGNYSISLSNLNPMDDDSAVVTTYFLSVPFPWYAGWVARCLYCLVLLAAAVLVYRLMQKRMKRRYELRQKEEMLAMANMKMDFFVNMSHELKTPLSLIIAPLSKLISETSESGQKKVLQLIHKNALRLNSLIYNVLDFRQIESKSEDQLIRSSVDLRSLIEDCVSNFTETVRERGVRLTFSPKVDSAWLNLDMLKMESVFTNLISNALKYVPDNTGTVDVSLRQVGDNICATVSDNGPGIREEDLPFVFIRFFQGKNRSGVSKGTGIGLYLVKKFVELHEGRVELRNAGGLTVEVTIPTTGDNAIAVEPTNESEPAAAEASEKKVLLIIDDTRDLVSFLHGALSSQYCCVKAFNGKEGLKAVGERMPDLIIVDQMMPEMDGLEFTRTIRRNYPTAAIPIIMLTAKDDNETELKSIQAGIDAFVSKPFDLKKLMLRIAQLLSRQQSLERAVRIEVMATPDFEDVGASSSPDEVLMKKISAAIEENMEDEDFGVTALAQMVGVESKQLYRKIKQMTGMTPVGYIRKLRMKKAAMLLSQNKFTVLEVMYLVGYSSTSHFTKCFAEEFGTTPKQFAAESGRSVRES